MYRDVDTLNQKDAKRGEKFYSLLRDYIEHEDGLINKNMTWLMSVQAFLIATFGFSYQKKFEVVGKALMDEKFQLLQFTVIEYDAFLITLTLVGIFTSLFAKQTINAAFCSITHLRERWIKFYSGEWSKICEMHPQIDYLHDITGGDDITAHIKGFKFPNRLPMFFLIFWSVILVLMLLVIWPDYKNIQTPIKHEFCAQI